MVIGGRVGGRESSLTMSVRKDTHQLRVLISAFVTILKLTKKCRRTRKILYLHEIEARRHQRGLALVSRTTRVHTFVAEKEFDALRLACVCVHMRVCVSVSVCGVCAPDDVIRTCRSSVRPVFV